MATNFNENLDFFSDFVALRIHELLPLWSTKIAMEKWYATIPKCEENLPELLAQRKPILEKKWTFDNLNVKNVEGTDTVPSAPYGFIYGTSTLTSPTGKVYNGIRITGATLETNKVGAQFINVEYKFPAALNDDASMLTDWGAEYGNIMALVVPQSQDNT